MTKRLKTTLPDLSDILKNLYFKGPKADKVAYFTAATLCIENPFNDDELITLSFSEKCSGPIGSCFLNRNYFQRLLTEEEIYYYSLLYVKVKTPNHHFYSEAQKRIKEYREPSFPYRR